jgi:hypothetical protein
MSRARATFAWLALLTVGGCQCLQPVRECPPDCESVCVAWDGGGVPGPDAGADASVPGFTFLGDTCNDQPITLPVTTPGVFTSLPDCIACGCAPRLQRPGVLAANTVCTEVRAWTNSPEWMPRAFPELTAASCNTQWCVVWKARTDAGEPLGDAGLARACQSTLVTNVYFVDCATAGP